MKAKWVIGALTAFALVGCTVEMNGEGDSPSVAAPEPTSPSPSLDFDADAVEEAETDELLQACVVRKDALGSIKIAKRANDDVIAAADLLNQDLMIDALDEGADGFEQFGDALTAGDELALADTAYDISDLWAESADAWRQNQYAKGVKLFTAGVDLFEEVTPNVKTLTFCDEL